MHDFEADEAGGLLLLHVQPSPAATGQGGQV